MGWGKNWILKAKEKSGVNKEESHKCFAFLIKYPFKTGTSYTISMTFTKVESDQNSLLVIQTSLFTDIPDPNKTNPIL
jgi:hypothetical protein